MNQLETFGVRVKGDGRGTSAPCMTGGVGVLVLELPFALLGMRCEWAGLDPEVKALISWASLSCGIHCRELE